MRSGAAIRRACIGAIIATGVAAPCALAAPGDLDPSFGNGGTAIVDIGASDFPTGLAMQGDLAVISGNTNLGTTGQNLFALRLTTAGAPDPAFGVGGSRLIDAPADLFGSGVAVQPTGSIVLATRASNGTNPPNFGVAQLTPEGAIDTGFGSGGTRTVDFGGGESALGPPALQTDGSILVPGSTDVSGTSDFAVIRLSSGGTPDTAGFNPPSGFQFANISGPDFAYAALQQPDGKVLLAGSASNNSDVALIRLTAGGLFDNGFGGNPIPGEALINLGGSFELARSIALLPDGRILIAGVTDAGPAPDNTFLARLSPTGTPDPTFGQGGAAIVDLGGDEDGGGRSLAVQPNGRILVSSRNDADLKVARFNANGSLDGSFAGGGVATVSSTGVIPQTYLGLQPDGKILVAGGTLAGPNPANMLVARLEGDSPTDSPPVDASCAGKNATLAGGDGDDTLKGTGDDDVIAALGGKDKVKAGGGDDLVCAGGGNDNVKGAAGKDKLRGEDGKDKLSGGGGKDRLNGGKGKDKCTGGGGKDKLKCEKERG